MREGLSAAGPGKVDEQEAPPMHFLGTSGNQPPSEAGKGAISVGGGDAEYMTAKNGPYQGFAKPMSRDDFERLSGFIQEQCGIKMPPGKKVMLEARLQKRLRVLGIGTFREYCDYLFNHREGSDEIIQMINVVTTNKTDFYREPQHFTVLNETVLPEFVQSAEWGPSSTFRVWSAGCSTGEEPYTLAMVLSEFAARCPGFRFSILATDISTRVLDRAKTAVYDEERVAAVPPSLKNKYLMRSRDRQRPKVRIVPELRALVQFEQVNLMEEGLRVSDLLDTVFCRNVIIYFERRNQEQLLRRLCGTLKDGGYLFLGHSETVHGFDLPLERVTSTVYRKVT